MISQTNNLVRWNRARVRRQACKPRISKNTIPPRPCREFVADLTIEEPQGDSNEKTILPFDLWPKQEEALEVLEQERLVIFLKARQLGITWLILAYILWLCIFKDGVSILVFSKGKDEAKELIRRVRGMYERYKGFKPRRTVNNKMELAWANGSRITALPATEHGGRSFTATVIFFDEYAFMQFGKEVVAAAKPSIDAGGKMFIVTTANGEGDDFHGKYKAAEEGKSGFVPIFLPWYARPGRDLAWYRRVEAEADDPTDMLREYPATPEEAFTPHTTERFIDMTLWDRLKEELPPIGRREPMVVALDAGVSDDCFGLVGVTRHPDPKRRERCVAIRLAMIWKPEKGKKLDYIRIKKAILEVCKKYDVVEIVYDPYQLHLMLHEIEVEGAVAIHELEQGKTRLIADKSCRDLIMQNRLAHTGGAILREHVDNANMKTTQDRQLRIVKRDPKKKIDLLVCTSMASYRCLELPL